MEQTFKAGTVITTYRPEYDTTHRYMLIRETQPKTTRRPYRLLSLDGAYVIMATFKSMNPEDVINYLAERFGMSITHITHIKQINM